MRRWRTSFCVEPRKSVRSSPDCFFFFFEHRMGSCIAFNSARVLLEVEGTQYRHLLRPSSTSPGRSTPADLGRYVRTTESIASSSLHYAFSGVTSPAPALQGRIGLFHRRAAPPHRPVRASPSSRTSSRSSTSSRPRPVRRGRWPLSVALPSSRRTSSTLRQRLCALVQARRLPHQDLLFLAPPK